MKLPEFPTDNLYKFMAITGLLLFFSGYYLFWIRYFELGPAVVDVTTEINVLQVNLKNLADDQENLISDLNDLKNETEEYEQKLSEGAKPETKIVEGYEQDLKALIDKDSQINNNAREYQEVNIRLDGSNKKLSQKLEELRWISKGLLVIPFIGIFISITGFKLWYEKLQKPMDRKLSRHK